MTKDLAILVSEKQDWHSTEDFLGILDKNLNHSL